MSFKCEGELMQFLFLFVIWAALWNEAIHLFLHSKRKILFSQLTVDCLEAQKKLHKMIITQTVLTIPDPPSSNAKNLLMPELLTAEMSVDQQFVEQPTIRPNVVSAVTMQCCL